METIKTIFSGFALMVILQTGLIAQQGVVSSGGMSTGSGGSASYTIGQIDYNSSSGTNGNIIEGMQQPFEISEVTGIEFKNIVLTATLFPNPSQGNLILKIENDSFENFSFCVYDNLGKLLIRQRMEGAEATVNLMDKAAGTYFLKVYNQNEEIKSFKILKQQ